MFPLRLNSELLDVVFNLTVPAFNTLAFITAIVPLVAVTPGLFPCNVIAKLACPLVILPLGPKGVRIVLDPKISPLVIL